MNLLCQISVGLLLVVGASCFKYNELDAQLDMVLKEVDYSDYMLQRHLEAEYRTGQEMQFTLDHLRATLNESINMKLALLNNEVVRVVEFQLLKEPTAISCARAVFSVLQKSIAKGLYGAVDECVETAERSITKLSKELDEDWQEYRSVKEAAAKGIEDCFRVHTDCRKEERARCVRTSKDTFFSKGKVITDRYFAPSGEYKTPFPASGNTLAPFSTSPFMDSFKNVAACIDEAAEQTDAALEEYVEKLFSSCAKNVNDQQFQQNIAAQKPETSRYLINSSLVNQIEKSQRDFYSLNKEVEDALQEYYSLEKKADVSSLFEERTEEEILESVKKTLDPYFAAIDALCINPADRANTLCTDIAKENLSHLSKMITEDTIHCDYAQVLSAREKIDYIRSALAHMVCHLSVSGNPEILKCVSEAPLFKTNAVEKCYGLSQTEFKLKIKSITLKDVEATLESLMKIEATYFALQESPLACDPLILQHHLLSADRELDTMSKCIYKQSGRDYNIRPVVDTNNTIPNNNDPKVARDLVAGRRKRSTFEDDFVERFLGIVKFIFTLLL